MPGEGPASTSVARPALQDVDAGSSPGMTWRASASLEVIWSFPRESQVLDLIHQRGRIQPFKPVSAMFSMMRRRISRNTISIGTTLTTEPAISLPVSLLKANWKVVSPSSMLNSD